MFMSLCRRKLRSGASVQRSTCTGKSNHGDRVVTFYKMAVLDPPSSHSHPHKHPRRWRPSRCYGAKHVAFKIKAGYAGLSLELRLMLKRFRNEVYSRSPRSKLASKRRNIKGGG